MHAYANRAYSRLKILAMFDIIHIIPTRVMSLNFMHIQHFKGCSMNYSYTTQHSKPLKFSRSLRKRFKP